MNTKTLVVIIVVVVAVLVFFVFRDGTNPEDVAVDENNIGVSQILPGDGNIDPASTVSDPAGADVATVMAYTSTQYGFGFNYPVTWVVTDTKDGIKLTPPNIGASDITFLVSPKLEGEYSIDCPVSTHEVECKTIENPNGVLYTRTINTGQLQYDKRQQLNGWFLISNIHVQMRALISDNSGNALQFRANTISVFDGILLSIKNSQN